MKDSIFSPVYDITPMMGSALEDIERQGWLIDNMLLMPKHEAWIRREVQVRRAAGTTRIEGATLDDAAVSKLINKRSDGRLTEDEQANVNALQAYDFVDFLSDQPDVPLDELVIRQLNRFFIAGSVETLTPGVYRKGENKVSRFAPPDQGDVPSLMRAFALWLRQDDDVHPVLKAGLAHIHLVAVHPFWDGNGRTARALAALILQRSKFGLRKLLSMESYLFEIRDDYFTAIERTLDTRFSPGYDATAWLEFFTLALKFHVEGLTAKLTEWHRMMQDIYQEWATQGWTQRQVEPYMFAVRTGQITRSDYIEISGVSPVTASRDLADLVNSGLLVPDGKTRSRIYRPVPDAERMREPASEQLPLLEATNEAL